MFANKTCSPRPLRRLRQADAKDAVALLGIVIDNVSMMEAVDQITARALARLEPAYVVTPNAHHVVMLQRHGQFAAAYRGAWLVLPDGQSLVLASRLSGTPLRERVTGADLCERVCAVAAERGLRIFLLGGRPGAADRARESLQRRFPGLNIVGTYCPTYGFENDSEELRRMDKAVRSASPHVLFVGLGAPKQELWIAEHHHELDVPVSVGVGVTFEFLGGMVRRAPPIMQFMGMEWLYRLLCEPRRLWRRYLIGNCHFIALVVVDLWRRRMSAINT